MKKSPIFLLIISVLLWSPNLLLSQEADATETQVIDTTESTPEKYGLRVGIDLSKPIRSLIDPDYQGLEIKADYRFKGDFYIAAELGNEQQLTEEQTVRSFAKGSYGKIGVDYNVYNNWEGMRNLIYVGLRVGVSSFTTELREYGVYNSHSYFEPDIRTQEQKFDGLTGSWVEFQIGLKVELLNNLYLGAHVEVKSLISEKVPDNFANLYIPGFNRTYDFGTSGVGYGYSISYLIPLFQK